jgi:hypothetical protein
MPNTVLNYTYVTHVLQSRYVPLNNLSMRSISLLYVYTNLSLDLRCLALLLAYIIIALVTNQLRALLLWGSMMLRPAFKILP